MREQNAVMEAREILLPAEHVAGTLRLPHQPRAVVALVHDSGVTRADGRGRLIARTFGAAGLATLAVDLLDSYERVERHHVLDVSLQAGRLAAVIDWLRRQPETTSLPIGLFGTGIGTGVVLAAAASLPRAVSAVVCCSGRPDIASQWLHQVCVPTLFIADRSGRGDFAAHSYDECGAPKEIIWMAGPELIPAATDQACRWFIHHLETAPAQYLLAAP